MEVLKFINSKTATPGTIVTDNAGTIKEDHEVRKVEIVPLNVQECPSTTFWYHITKYLTQNIMNNYKEVTGSKYLNPDSIENPQILKLICF